MKLFILLVSISGLCFAHSGGTNSSGCHNDHKNGGYHCHKADDLKEDTLRNPTSIQKDNLPNDVVPKGHKSLIHQKRK